MLKALMLLAILFLSSVGVFGFALKRPNSRWTNALLVGWAVLLPLLAAEAYYSFFYVESENIGYLGENFKKKYHHNDAYGYRDSNLPLSHDKPNIVIVGDSLAYGYGLKSPEQRLSNMLQKALPGYHVVNLSKPAVSTIDEISFLLKAVDSTDSGARVDWVILSYYLNDIEDSIPKKVMSAHRKLKRINPVIKLVVENSELLRRLYYDFVFPIQTVADSQQKMFHDAYTDPNVLKAHMMSVNAFAHVAQQGYQARFLIVLWPFLNALNETDEYQAIFQQFEAAGYNTLDLWSVLHTLPSSQLTVSRKDFHPSEQANRLATQQVLRVIQDKRF